MRRLLTGLAPLALLLSACGEREPLVRFRVAVGDLPGGARRQLAAGRAPDDTLELSLPGTWYHPPMVFRLAADSPDRSTMTGAMAADFAAFKLGDPQRILDVFAAADTAEIRSFLGDSGVVAGSTTMFRHIEAMTVHAVAHYTAGGMEYRLAFFTYRDERRRGNVHVYVNQDGEWKRTNALSRGHETLLLAVMAYRFGTIAPAS